MIPPPGASTAPAVEANPPVVVADRVPRVSARQAALLLVLVTGVAAVLRSAGIGDKSLWVDEAFSVFTSREPLGSLWRITVDYDFHPPLYYALLHHWRVLGEGEAALRSLSALLSVLTVPVVFLIGARLGGPVLGLVSSGLVAISPLQVAYAQQARMYALMTFCAALSILFLLLVLEEPDPAGKYGATARRRLWWAAFVVSTVLTMLSHNTGVLLPVSVAVFVVLALLRSAGRSADGGAGERLTDALRHPFHGVVGVATGLGAAVVLWLPWLPFFVSQAREVDDEFWISSPTVASFLQHWHDLVSAYGPPEHHNGYVLVGVAVLTVLGVRQLRGRLRAALLLLLVLLVPVAVELMVSLRRPIFSTQTLVWSSVPFSVLLAAGVLHLRLRSLVVTVAGVVLVLDVVALSRYYADDGKEDWRTATQYVARRVQARDLVFFSAAWVQVPFDYYYVRSGGPPVTRRGLPTDLFEGEALEEKMTSAALPRLDRLTRGASTVWVVLSHDWYTDPQGLVTSHLGRSFRVAEERAFTEVTVVRYERVSA